MNLRWKFIYLERRPSSSPLLSSDVVAHVDVVDLKLSISLFKTSLRSRRLVRAGEGRASLNKRLPKCL